MYKIGEFIVYGNDGVCEIEDIGNLNINSISKDKTYYTLRPVNESGKIFAPIDTKVFMRPIITYDEIQEIIKQIPLIRENEIDIENTRKLQEHYKGLFKTHECIDLITIIINIADKQDNLHKKGKKLGQLDDKFMKMARNQLDDEFSIALGIPKEEVTSYIKSQINK